MAKTALITGSSQGIGACIAERLAKEGYNVAINCRNAEDGYIVTERCRAYGVEAECYVADVSDFSACEEMVKKVVARFGSLDVLVNNAGITKDGLLPRMSENQFDMVISINLKGVFNMMRHGSGVMIKQRGGKIINISSVAGVFGNAGQVNYSASKAGVIGMTMTAAKELGKRGITVNAIAPGFIETRMTEVLPDAIKEGALQAISLKRFGLPEEIAGVVAFLAGDDANYITGQTIVVDGGMAM